MMNRRRTFSALAFTLFDLGVTAGAFLLAAWIRSRLAQDPGKPFVFRAHLWLLPTVAAVWAPLLWAWGLHRSQRTDQAGAELWKVVKTVAAGSLVVVAAIVVRKFDPSRLFLGLFAGIDLASLALFRMACVSVARHQRKRGYDRVYVVVVGTGKAARQHVEELRAHPEWGLEVRGWLSEAPKLALEEVAGLRVLGSIADLPGLLKKEVVDEVHFAVSRRTLERLDEAVRVCDEMGVTVRIVMSLLGKLNSRPSLEHLAGASLLTLSSAPRDEAALGVKRI
ncbi:MAG TPA: hypothetical protein VJB14_15070, partial [Planctomycetota bacterium]|nr:hypothetical protein [Planctomycetota bacterium]